MKKLLVPMLLFAVIGCGAEPSDVESGEVQAPEQEQLENVLPEVTNAILHGDYFNGQFAERAIVARTALNNGRMALDVIAEPDDVIMARVYFPSWPEPGMELRMDADGTGAHEFDAIRCDGPVAYNWYYDRRSGNGFAIAGDEVNGQIPVTFEFVTEDYDGQPMKLGGSLLVEAKNDYSN
jgi:hypothetical protein